VGRTELAARPSPAPAWSDDEEGVGGLHSPAHFLAGGIGEGRVVHVGRETIDSLPSCRPAVLPSGGGVRADSRLTSSVDSLGGED
jgi:hypothetical protein